MQRDPLEVALRERDEARRGTESLHRISKLLHAELDVEKVVQRLTDEATALCRAEFGAFFYNLINDAGESYTLYTLAGVPREKFSKFPMPRNTAIFGPTFRGEGVVRLDDVTKDPRFGKNAPHHGMPKGHLPVCSYLAVSVMSRTGDVIGGLFFGHSQPGVFTEADEALIVAVGAQAGNAIENARLYEAERKARAAAEQAQQRTAKLHAITAALSYALGAEDTARTVIREAMPVMGATAGAVLLLTPDGTAVERVMLDGATDPAIAQEIQRASLAVDLPLATAARTGVTTWVVGADEIERRYPQFTGRTRTAGIQTWGAVPLVFEGKTIGSLGLRCGTERPVAKGEEELLLAIGRQCAQAIERARLHDATQVARAEAEQANRAKDEFLAMLGHELRNPLSPILTALQLMKLRGETGSQKEQLVIERQVNHLIRLVDDLLDISRITRGKVILEKRPVRLATLVTKAVEIASPLFEQHQHNLDVSLPEADVWLEADELRICQVLTNLLTNAAKYTPRGGRIQLVATTMRDRTSVSVKDNGMGISSELLPRVFDLFVQGYQASDRGQGGLGIGLALVKNLVAMHDGTIHATSAGAGLGSEFVLELPTIDLSRPAPTPTAESERIIGGVHVLPRRVLVVDDNEDAASLLADVLRSVGHEVVVAHDGPRALDVLARFDPEVAILDIGLPVMDGYELAGELRGRLGQAIRMMAVTGYGQESDQARAREAGFEAHFVKPVGVAKLLAAIEVPRL